MFTKVLTIKDPKLREVSKDVKVKNKKDKQAIQDLKDTLKVLSLQAFGLSAIQIGHPLRVFILNLPVIERDNEKESLIIINPKILKLFKGPLTTQIESCLSIPDVYASTTRPPSVSIEFIDEQGLKVERMLNDTVAIVFLHEYDHLNGVWFIDRAFNREERRKFQRKNRIKIEPIKDPYDY